jgi:nicotinamidase-related amidase
MKRALLVIDVQNEYFTGQLPVTYPNNSFENLLIAMDEATQNAISIIVVRHTQPNSDSPIFRQGSPEWELHPEIAKRKYNLLVDKKLPGSFTGTNLEPWLREKEIDTLAISGYMTQMCCDTTARQAVHLGFGVEFLCDSTGTLAFETAAGNATAEELHRSTLVAQSSFFSQVLTTTAWVQGL